MKQAAFGVLPCFYLGAAAMANWAAVDFETDVVVAKGDCASQAGFNNL